MTRAGEGAASESRPASSSQPAVGYTPKAAGHVAPSGLPAHPISKQGRSGYD